MNFKHIHGIFLILMLIIQTSHCYAFEFTEDKGFEEDVWELNFGENLLYPSIPTPLHSVISNNIKEQYEKLKKQGYNVTLERNGEVIRIVLSADELLLDKNLKTDLSKKVLCHYVLPVKNIFQYAYLHNFIENDYTSILKAPSVSRKEKSKV